MKYSHDLYLKCDILLLDYVFEKFEIIAQITADYVQVTI